MFPFIVTEAAHLEPGYRSAVQENALVVSLQMFNLILEKCVSLLREQLERPTEAQSSRLLVSEDLQVLLPAVKVSGIVYFLASLQNCERTISFISATGRSLVQRSPPECVCVCVCCLECDQVYTSISQSVFCGSLPKGSATNSQGIRGYVSVMTTSKFSNFFP